MDCLQEIDKDNQPNLYCQTIDDILKHDHPSDLMGDKNNDAS